MNVSIDFKNIWDNYIFKIIISYNEKIKINIDNFYLMRYNPIKNFVLLVVFIKLIATI